MRVYVLMYLCTCTNECVCIRAYARSCELQSVRASVHVALCVKPRA